MEDRNFYLFAGVNWVGKSTLFSTIIEDIKGIVSDMYVDHFLCKNFENIFCENPDFENVEKVERKIIKNIEKYDRLFPNDFRSFFDWLRREKVLARYKNLDFLERVFLGMSKRVRKGEILKNAVCELKNNYEEFEEKSLREFLFVKGKIVKNFEGSEKLWN